ncbi:hypothetical protein LA080_006197 [Diaporthe eres]|nr:hypothetical protein LA080_006197 [Diaporthe eres]
MSAPQVNGDVPRSSFLKVNTLSFPSTSTALHRGAAADTSSGTQFREPVALSPSAHKACLLTPVSRTQRAKANSTKHLYNYHIVHDGIETFKSNPYGAKSIQLGDSAYQTFAAPIVPYFNGPYQYVQPYVKKADDLGDKALTKVDERFPVVKKPTNELYTDAKGLVLFPYHKGIEGRDHVFSTYSSEYKKANGGNESGFALISTGKAAIATALVLTGETVRFIGDFLHTKKEEAHNAVDNKVNNN